MRVTDPNAIKTIKHPSDDEAEFDISVSMTREKRMQFQQDYFALAPGEKDPVVIAKYQAYYGRLVKDCLKGLRGVFDASGGILALTMPISDGLLKQLCEVRLPDEDNLVLWIGKEIYKENILSDSEKKRLASLLNTDSGKTGTEVEP
jgi:hypothetical protein